MRVQHTTTATTTAARLAELTRAEILMSAESDPDAIDERDLLFQRYHGLLSFSAHPEPSERESEGAYSYWSFALREILSDALYALRAARAERREIKTAAALRRYMASETDESFDYSAWDRLARQHAIAQGARASVPMGLQLRQPSIAA